MKPLAAGLLLSVVLPTLNGLAQSSSIIQLSESADIKLAELMQLLGQRSHGAVRFRETRHFARLKEEIVVTGVMSFQTPDRLVRIVEQPKWERIDVAGNEVTVTTGRHDPPRTIQLSDFPALNGMIVALRATLTGNESQLLEVFAIHPEGTKEDWRIRLFPRAGAIQEKLVEIVISGRNDRPTRFALTQRNGDRIVISMSEQ